MSAGEVTEFLCVERAGKRFAAEGVVDFLLGKCTEAAVAPGVSASVMAEMLAALETAEKQRDEERARHEEAKVGLPADVVAKVDTLTEGMREQTREALEEADRKDLAERLDRELMRVQTPVSLTVALHPQIVPTVERRPSGRSPRSPGRSRATAARGDPSGSQPGGDEPPPVELGAWLLSDFWAEAPSAELIRWLWGGR